MEGVVLMGTLEALIPENSDEMVISVQELYLGAFHFLPRDKKEKDNLRSSVLLLAKK